MYAEHVGMIAPAMLASDVTFNRGCLFAALSARQPITSIPDMLRDVDANGEEARALALSTKYECWSWLQSNTPRATVARLETREALEMLAYEVPGLGIVKAAFVLQFIGRDIGCLDTHNLKKMRIPINAFKHQGHGKGYFKPQFERYLALASGKARELWDTWCEDRAAWYETTPEEISALHLAVIEEPQKSRVKVNAELPANTLTREDIEALAQW